MQTDQVDNGSPLSPSIPGAVVPVPLQHLAQRLKIHPRCLVRGLVAGAAEEGHAISAINISNGEEASMETAVPLRRPSSLATPDEKVSLIPDSPLNARNRWHRAQTAVLSATRFGTVATHVAIKLPGAPMMAEDTRPRLGGATVASEGKITDPILADRLRRGTHGVLVQHRTHSKLVLPHGPRHHAHCLSLPSAIEHAQISIQHVKHEAEEIVHHVDEVLHLEIVVRYSRPLVGWIMLGLGFSAWVGTVPVYNLMTGPSTLMMVTWRELVLLLLTVPCLIGNVVVSPRHFFVDLKALLHDPASLGRLAGLGVLMCGYRYTMSMSYQTTNSYCQPYIFGSLHPILLLGLSLAQHQEVGIVERCGAGFGLLGVVLLLIFSVITSTLPCAGWAVLSSICIAGHLLLSKRVRATSPFFLIIFIQTVIALLIALFFTLVFEQRPASEIPQVFHGEYVTSVVLLGVLNLIGYAGFIGCLKYLPALYISLAMGLISPVALVFGIFDYHYDTPGPWEVSGTLLVVLAIIAITVGTEQLAHLQLQRHETISFVTGCKQDFAGAIAFT